MLLINVGCGPHPAPTPWVNIERNPDLVPPDGICCNATDLPYEDDDVDAAYLGHILEHATLADEVPRILDEVRRVLRPGAPCMVVGPCMDRAIREGYPEQTLEDIRGAKGVEHIPGASHQWVCTESLLVQVLTDAGFANVEPMPIEQVPAFWPVVSYVTWQAAVLATCP